MEPASPAIVDATPSLEDATAASYSRATANLTSAIHTPSVAVALDPHAALASGTALKGRVVLVTGAGSGIGRAYAIQAARFGAKLVVSDVVLAPLLELVKEIEAKGGKATAVKCDVTSWDEQVALFKHGIKTYGALDIVFANAGIGEHGGEWLSNKKVLANGDPVKPDLSTLTVNLIGVSYTAKLAFFYFDKNPSKQKKSLVFIGSMASHTGIPGGPIYSSAKHGVLGLFRSLYFNGEAYGINLNCVCPWFLDTGILTPLTRLGIAGLPLASVDDVVAAAIRSSADPTFSGNTIAVDAKGILAIPFTAFSPGEEGYYAEFARRATMTISLERYAIDAVKIVKASVKYWLRSKRGRGLILGLLFLAFRYKRGEPAP